MYRYLEGEEVARLGLRSVGKNVRIHNSAQLVSPKTLSIADNVRIDGFVTLTGDVTIGRYVHIGPYCFLSGGSGIRMEDFSGLSARVTIYSASNDYSGEWMTGPMVPHEMSGPGKDGPVVIGRHVVVGATAVILPNLTVGEGCAIGAMALVNKSTEPWGIYGGVPARRIKERSRRILELEAAL